MMFLLRLSPWLVAGIAALGSWWQWSAPELYPWLLVFPIVGYGMVAIGLVWRSRLWRQGLMQLCLPLIAIISLAFGHLLMETQELRLVTSALFTFIPWAALELGWFLLYDSARYPLHGLSRFNLALVPVTLWYVAFTLHGLHIILQILPWLFAAILMGVTVACFVGTAGSWRDRRERRWLIASLLIGVHVAILLLLLPSSMVIHGAITALLVALPLRLRSLMIYAKPPIYLIYIESGVLGAIWLAILFSARWT